MLTRDEVLGPLAAGRGDAVVVSTMSMVRPWARFSSSDLDFASADSAMGHAADLALGIALARPERTVICLNGDGSMLMSLGTLATIAGQAPPNLIIYVIQNDTFEITGNQPVPGAGGLDFAALARAAGFPRAFSFSEPGEYALRLPLVLSGTGPTLVAVQVEAGTEGPLTRGNPREPEYLRSSLAEAARRLRKALGS